MFFFMGFRGIDLILMLIYLQLDHRHARVQLQEFMERAGNYWRKFTVISWVVSFHML